MDHSIAITGTADDARRAVRAARHVLIRSPWGLVGVVKRQLLQSCLRGPMTGWLLTWTACPEGTLIVEGAERALPPD